MSNYYKLIDTISSMQRINVARRENGIVRYGHVDLYPGKKYEIEDDELLMNSLKKAKTSKRYTSKLVYLLNQNNIKYEEKYCKSCGGRVKNIEYHLVEVVENEES